MVTTPELRGELEVDGVNIAEWAQGPNGLALKGVAGAAGWTPTPNADETALILPTSGTTGAGGTGQSPAAARSTAKASAASTPATGDSAAKALSLIHI